MAEKGKCYENSANYLLEHPGRGLHLCHGIVTGTDGPVKGIQYGHAWIENASGTVVIDVSTAKEMKMPAALYYAVGQIEHVVRYNFAEAIEQMDKHEHYGPWDAANNRACDRAMDQIMAKAARKK